MIEGSGSESKSVPIFDKRIRSGRPKNLPIWNTEGKLERKEGRLGFSSNLGRQRTHLARMATK